jgi:hypothetical protein
LLRQRPIAIEFTNITYTLGCCSKFGHCSTFVLTNIELLVKIWAMFNMIEIGIFIDIWALFYRVLFVAGVRPGRSIVCVREPSGVRAYRAAGASVVCFRLLHFLYCQEIS